MTIPLDHPTPERPHRLYFAVTNHCNRACPWCSTYSSPKKMTFLSFEAYEKSFPEEGFFEVQLEGGEPTVHPEFDRFVSLAVSHPRVSRLVLCTNGVLLPRSRAELRTWLLRFGERFTLKISFNHYLRGRDPQLLPLLILLKELFDELGGDRLLVINVRLRKGYDNDDAVVLSEIEQADLKDCANIFFLQRYGLASDQEDWETPFLAGTNFSMVNPDGRVFGPELVMRSEAMGALP